MVTEFNIYVAIVIATILLAFSVRLGVSLYKAS